MGLTTRLARLERDSPWASVRPRVAPPTFREFIAAVRPGVPYRDIHLAAARSFVVDLTAAGLMKGDPDAAVSAGAHALFFPHGLGHMIGLDVHDMENLGEELVGYGPGFTRSGQFGLGYLRLARVLEPGFVLTVEPGLYFIPALIDQWKADGTNAAFLNFDEIGKFLGDPLSIDRNLSLLLRCQLAFLALS